MRQAEIDESVREFFEERAAIIEFEGGFPRAFAEYEARQSAQIMRLKLEGLSDGKRDFRVGHVS